MSRNASINLDFGDGAHAFRLAWGQLVELQEKCDAGPYVVLRRLMDGSWRMADIAETIRIGLVGGGMAPGEAIKLVRRYVEARPPMESILHAQAILSAALMGAPEEKPGEPEGEAESGSTTSPTESSASPDSTAPVQ